MKTTKLFTYNLKAFKNKDRLIINQGGARAGKTYAILQLLFFICFYSKKPLIISVVSQTIPHLKKGAIRDFKNIVFSAGINFDKHFNKTELIFSYNNCIIEFFSADNSGKVHGAARNILFINECNYLTYEIFEQLDIRTEDIIFLDYNPKANFWVQSEIINKGIEHTFIHSTYKDNDYLSSRIRQAIESREGDNNWWRVYGLGLMGFSENILFGSGKMKRFKLSELDRLDKKSYNGTFSYTDVAYGGGDYLCTVIADVYERNVYVKDVVFNKNSADLNDKLLVSKLRKNNVKNYAIETNAGGAYFGDRIYNEYLNNYTSIKSHVNKITRIITESIDIIDNFYFLEDNEMQDSEYELYFNNLTSFDVENKNKNDDAPDATAGLCNFLRNDFYIFD